MDLTETQDHFGIVRPLDAPGGPLLLTADPPAGLPEEVFPPLTPVPRDPPARQALPAPAADNEPPAPEPAPVPPAPPADEAPASTAEPEPGPNLFIQPTQVPPGTRVPRLGADPAALTLGEVPSPRTDDPMPAVRPLSDAPIDPRVVQQITAVEQHVIWLGKQVRQGVNAIEAMHGALQKLTTEVNRQISELRDTQRSHWSEISSEKRARAQMAAGNKKMLELYDEVLDVRDKLAVAELQLMLMFWKQRLAEYHIRRLEGHAVERESISEALQYVRYYQEQVDRRTTGQPASADSPPPAGG